MELPPAFYIRDGDRFIATDLTRGPWGPIHQHGGPPAALFVRAIEARISEVDPPPALARFQLARLTVELWRPVPIGPLRVQAQVVRPGKKVQVVDATLSGEEGPLGRASAVLIRRAPTEAAVAEARESRDRSGSRSAGGALLPPPDACPPFRFPFFAPVMGYHEGVETRLARGVFGAGDMAMWFRMRRPLVLGEEPSPLQRTLLAADSANGVSVGLDLARWTFVNPDMTVVLHRPPEGEWICLESTAEPGPAGAGLVETRLHDLRGPVGRSLQSIVIEARAAAEAGR